MKNQLRKVLTISLITIAFLGLSFNVVQGQSTQEDRNAEYRELLNNVDGIIRAIRFGKPISGNRIETLKDRFDSVFPNQGGDIRNEIADLDPSTLAGEEGVEKVREIRGDIVELAENSTDVGLSFIYKYAVFIILGVSFGLAVMVSMISRIVVDWEEVNKVRNKQSEIKDELDKAKENGDQKKVHKLQKKQQQFMQEHAGTMFSPMKTMLIIFIPFIIVFRLLSSTYGGWVVAWLPFNLPWPDINFLMLNRFFKGTVVSLGFFGWYLLCYFGLSQILRKILVPQQ
ncbi:hypothetical protein AKJ51_04770 [candidate division MSBL1 archaeon SCGC-AAA382A20]|uniref:DUF106 domain-containing protein n=1 Tax=candidate division MSBL1 archaeon SCGC-AAA382A20 TaxID=1698280 RepID=A0A133VH96_9EURY|nr:hypothetical protein AKJ51_04770 [candidate division MSBL1 archaeon SCGC-AAA382A20]